MPVLWIIAGAVFLYGMQFWVYRRFWNKALSVRLSFTKEAVVEGEQCGLEELVENRKPLPLPVLKVKFQVSRDLVFQDQAGGQVTDKYYRNDMLSVSGNERIRRTLFFRCAKRGYYTIEGMDLVAGSLLLDRELMESREEETALYVYPAPVRTPDFQRFLLLVNGEAESRRQLAEDPFILRGIRDYVPGDAWKSVNWKATARTGTLQVNQKGYTARSVIRILLHLETGTPWYQKELQELCIRLADTTAAFFLGQGGSVSLLADAEDLRCGAPVRVERGFGRGQLERIHRALAGTDTGKLTDGDWIEEVGREQGTYTVLISADGREELQRKLIEKQREKKAFCWICPQMPEFPISVLPPLQKLTGKLNAKALLEA